MKINEIKIEEIKRYRNELLLKRSEMREKISHSAILVRNGKIDGLNCALDILNQ